jgi:hypothetical protein
VRRECFETCGYFDERLSADYLAFFRIAARYRLAYVRDVVADYVVHEDNWSGDLERSLRARIDLFTEELARATIAEDRALFERLVFNLRLHLRFAALRGKARSGVVQNAPPLPRRPDWALAFLLQRLARRKK